MAEFASNAKGNAALTTGIIGTAGTGLALLNGLTGLLNGGGQAMPAAPAGTVWQTTAVPVNPAPASCGCDPSFFAGMAVGSGLGIGRGGCSRVCNEDHPVDRYEAAQSAKIAELETEVKFRDSSIYTDGKMLELYKYFDGKIEGLRAAHEGDVRVISGELAAQKVLNAQNADAFVMVRTDIDRVRENLMGEIRHEAEARCCADNAIVTYVNGTFYPKQVANVTTGTETTGQVLYNPLPNCGCGCGC